MMPNLSRLILLLAALLCFLFVLFVVNQTYQVVQLASALHPVAGQVLLVVLIGVYVVLLAIPVKMWLSLPRALRPPADETGPDFDIYVRQLGARLAGNPLLRGTDFALQERLGIEAALQELNKSADAIVHRTATRVFLTTAVSQNGRLDGLMVLVSLSIMVYQIAKTYNQRPSLGELLRLYANVAATAWITTEVIEEAEMAEILAPIMATIAPNVPASAVPGLSLVSNIVTESILEGAANAFLALRVGIIASRECSSLTTVRRGAMRRWASAEAAKRLPVILKASAATVAAAVWSASKVAGSSLFREQVATGQQMANGVRDGVGGLGGMARSAFRRVWPDRVEGDSASGF